MKILFTFLLVVCSVEGAQSATYYVATTGNNKNPGSSSLPWRSIAHAVSRMNAGDTTYVRGGTYNEGVIRFGRSGTSSAPIKLLNYGNENAIIDFGVKSFSDQAKRFEIRNASGSRVPIGWITIEGFQIRNAWDGIKFEGALNLTIRRNWIHHSINQGMGGFGKNVLVDRNIISSNGLTRLTHGIYMMGSNHVITNNLIYGNFGRGIQLAGYAFDPTRHPDTSFAGASNWMVANNTIAYNGSAGITIYRDRAENTKVYNNIFYENGAKDPSSEVNGVGFLNSGKGNTIRNNLFYASGSGGTLNISTVRYATEGVHYTQSGNITANPNFANAPATIPSSPSFALKTVSPAKDKGLNLWSTVVSTRTSYNGVLRPQTKAYDIGAYEYTGTSSLSVPSQVTNFRIESF